MADEQIVGDPNSQSSSEAIRVTDRPAEVACPRCATEMVFGELLKTKVVVCAKCHGVMIQNALFGEVVEHLRQIYDGPDNQPTPIEPSELEIAANCPACWKKMDVHPYCGPGNIVIDSCRDCHVVWLDGDELTRVIRGPGRR